MVTDTIKDRTNETFNKLYHKNDYSIIQDHLYKLYVCMYVCMYQLSITIYHREKDNPLSRL